MIYIRIGYIRGKENSHIYKKQLNFLEISNVDRIFHEKCSGNIELNELINYARSGDILFVYSIAMLGKNVKAIIRFIMQTREKNIELFVKKEKFNTSDQFGKYSLNIISALDEIIGHKELIERTEATNGKGRIPRELSDLRTYMKLVEKNEMTVKEACQKLHIGRTTYYRRCKQIDETIDDERQEFEDEII